jgi:hypothetical protein
VYDFSTQRREERKENQITIKQKNFAFFLCALAPLMRAIHGAHPEGRAEARPILFLTKLCVEFLINQALLA